MRRRSTIQAHIQRNGRAVGISRGTPTAICTNTCARTTTGTSDTCTAAISNHRGDSRAKTLENAKIMNRRQFGLGAMTAAAFAATSKAARSEKKDWAHEHLKGLGSLILPSFAPDFKSLDEEGIRLDIRHAIHQG